MKYFKEDTLSFLSELADNNNKEWFSANKARFKSVVEAPFHQFVADAIELLQPLIPDLNTTPKDCIFRIYKDVRFSKDKTPYKTHISAMINAGGRKNKTTPGAYLQLSGQDFRLYSGCFQLTPKQIGQIRTTIHDNQDRFNRIISAPAFTNTFSEILGEKYKKLAPVYLEAAKEQPLILNKSFYYFKKYQPDLALKDNLLPTIISDFKQGLELNKFLLDALELTKIIPEQAT